MISQADLEEFLGIAAGTDTSLITSLEVEAVAWFENQTSRFFGTPAASSVTVFKPGNGQRNLYLDDIPNAITSVTAQIYPGADQTTITEGADEGFDVRDQHLVRRDGFVWQFGTEYIVVHTRGYATDAEPDDVRLAIKQIVKALYNSGDPLGGAVKHEKLGDYSYTLGAADEGILFDTIPTLRETLHHWRQVHV